LDEAWGGSFFSTIVYLLVAYTLLMHEETTLDWTWRIVLVVCFALIPAAFVRSSLLNGRFVLGLSKQGLLYQVKGAANQYVLCPWSQVVSVRLDYDGEQDFVVIGLVGSSGDALAGPVNGRVEDREGVRSLVMGAPTRRRALQIIGAIKRYWLNLNP
jgi:hypothetical protein